MNKVVIIIMTAVAVAGGLYAIRSLDTYKKAESDSTPMLVQNEVVQEINEDKQTVTLQANQLKIQNRVITVEVANSPDERMRGLSGRVGLQDGSGMLFIFDRPSTPDFWMKDMNFPIDIIWIDVNGVVVGFEEKVEPSTYPQTFSPNTQIQYVLEVASGWVSNNKIVEGAVVEGSMIK